MTILLLDRVMPVLICTLATLLSGVLVFLVYIHLLIVEVCLKSVDEK